MKIISKRQHHEVTTYYRFFEDRAHAGSGFSFDCDQAGNVDMEKLSHSGRESLAEALGSPDKFYDDVKENISRWTEPAVGECDDCGKEVSLRGFTNTCACGADYNMSGQRLAPREQWGEETGESVSDILQVDADNY